MLRVRRSQWGGGPGPGTAVWGTPQFPLIDNGHPTPTCATQPHLYLCTLPTCSEPQVLSGPTQLGLCHRLCSQLL